MRTSLTGCLFHYSYDKDDEQYYFDIVVPLVLSYSRSLQDHLIKEYIT